MQEVLSNVALNVVANSILVFLGIIYSTMTLQDYRREKSRQNRLFFSFEICGTIYLFLYVVELLTEALGASELFIFAISFVRVFFAILMYTAGGDYIVLLIEKTCTVPKALKTIIHGGLLVFFFIMPIVYALTKNELLTNLPIYMYLLLLQSFIIRYRQALAVKNVFILTLFITPSIFLLYQEYWNHTPANIYVVLLMIIIHCEIQQKQRIAMLEFEKQMIENKNELADARISLMSSQINPHFLFNTLSSIANLCEKNGKEAKYLTLEFASYMRNIAEDLDTRHTIPFAKELHHTEHYLNIERVRFGDKLRLEFDIAEMDFKLPPLTLQPLVENAIKHGLMSMDGGLVAIETSADDDAYYVRIMDDGIGFDQEKIAMDHKHIGIHNIAKRLEYMCGGELIISSEIGKGTQAVIKIPKETFQ